MTFAERVTRRREFRSGILLSERDTGVDPATGAGPFHRHGPVYWQ